MTDDALGCLAKVGASMPRSHLCKRKKKVIVVCKTAKHRDGKRDREDEEKIYSEREKEKKKRTYSNTWVRSFLSNLFHSLYSRGDVCDCVCVRDTPDVFYCYLFAVYFPSSSSVVCMIAMSLVILRKQTPLVLHRPRAR